MFSIVTASDALPNRIGLERSALRGLCGEHAGVMSASDAKTLLKKYVWQDPDNRVVFEALSGLSSSLTPAELREQLPAQATRLGFPDVPWENYLTPDEAGAKDVRSLIEQLLTAE
jgi:hypothetical protein